MNRFNNEIKEVLKNLNQHQLVYDYKIKNREHDTTKINALIERDLIELNSLIDRLNCEFDRRSL